MTSYSALPLSEQIATMVHGFDHREHKHEVRRIAREVAALEARCQALETALDRCIGSDGQAGLYALGTISEESYFERGGNNETTDKYRAMADEIIAAARKARAGT